jgi:hypothetical protein
MTPKGMFIEPSSMTSPGGHQETDFHPKPARGIATPAAIRAQNDRYTTTN